MNKRQIIDVLKEMALLMEIRGDNPFKIRAHANAARSLERLSESLEEWIASGQLTAIKGIGKGIADKIILLSREEALPEYQALKTALPEGLIEVARVPGLGPKKVKELWKTYGIHSLEGLENACKMNQLAEIKGFGPKIQEKIIQGVAQIKRFRKFHLFSKIQPVAEALLAAIRELPEVSAAEIAGALRRQREIVENIEILVCCEAADFQRLSEAFVQLPMVESVGNSLPEQTALKLRNGMSANIHQADGTQFFYALHHLTGSAAYLEALSQHAASIDLTMNSQGLHGESGLLPCTSEASLFQHLKIDYIPPELRENRGEIMEAFNQQLPQLVETHDIRGIIHTHSTWSDGVHSIAEMARACQALGYEYLVISDHSKSAVYANGLSETRIQQQHQEIDALNAQFEGFRILKGIECDILADGRLDYADEILASFEIVIASIHSKFNMTKDEGTRRIIKALENPFTTILGHPTGRLLLTREGYPIDHHAIIDAAAALGVAIEINSNPLRLDLDWRFCQYALEQGGMLSINPDAHHQEGLADIQYGVGIARKGRVSRKQVLNSYSAEAVLSFAKKRRPLA